MDSLVPNVFTRFIMQSVLGFRSFVAAELCQIDRSSLMLQKRSVPRNDQLAWDLVLGKWDVWGFFFWRG